MDYVTKRHESYRELVRSGIRCGTLQSRNRGAGRWQLECVMMSDMTNDYAKEKVMQYIRDQWQGSEFSWFRKHGDNYHRFYCVFTSFAL